MELQFNNAIVDFFPDVAATLRRYIQYPGKYEAGGILLGNYIPSENRYIITEATCPSFGISEDLTHLYGIKRLLKKSSIKDGQKAVEPSTIWVNGILMDVMFPHLRTQI